MSLMEKLAAQENSVSKAYWSTGDQPKLFVPKPAHTEAFFRMAESVAEAYEVSVEELRGSSRQKQFVMARDCFVGIARRKGHSLQDVAFFLGRRDAGTIRQAEGRDRGRNP